MKRTQKIAIGLIAGASLVLGASVLHAETGPMGGMGNMGGMGHGMGGAMHGQHAGTAGQLMTPAERQAMQEKMRSAKTPEERQQIAMANHAEMQKRAKEKGITLPEHGAGHGAGHQGHDGHGAHQGNGMMHEEAPAASQPR